MSKYEILELPLKFDLENKAILKQASLAHRQLAELKGGAPARYRTRTFLSAR